MTFGVLTTNSIEEALARSDEAPQENKGRDAALAAVEMVEFSAGLFLPGLLDEE